MGCHMTNLGTIRHYCDSMSNSSKADLGLLKAIDRTVDWLAGVQEKAAGELKILENIIEELIACDPETPIDSDDTICDSIENWGNALKESISILESKRFSAYNDPKLNGEHEESVTSEYELTIGTYQKLHDATVKLRWTIMEHDAEISPVIATFDNAKDLIAELRRA